MTGYLFVALAVLVAAAGWRVRYRLRHQSRSGVTDEIVHQIETLGRVDAEDQRPGDERDECSVVPSGDPSGTRRRDSSMAGVGRCGGSVGGAAGFVRGPPPPPSRTAWAPNEGRSRTGGRARDHRGWLRWRSDCVDTRRRCGHADETARRPEEYRTPDGFFPLPDGGTLLVDLGNARLIRIEVDLSFGETWSTGRGAPGTGLAMISPVGTDRTGGIYFRQRLGGMTGMSDSVNDPAVRPGFPAIGARQARSWRHGKSGRSCSPS